MGTKSVRRPRLASICRRGAPAAAAIIASGALSAQASAASLTVAVNADSVLATNLPSPGQTTIEAIRPDALTGAPVVIGLYSGTADSFSPFSVNTTTPTALNPAGDCWQKGALSQALTPDLQPGDTVTLSQPGSLGSGPTASRVQVQPSGSGAAPGPISGCSSIAPWARNLITSAPDTVTGAPLTVSGVAQPLAAGVSVSASDGIHATAPVAADLASDGSWTATIPASALAPLANTKLAVTPVIAVPDVSTGAQAHITGVGLSLTKSAPPHGTTPGHTGGTGSSPSQTSGRGPTRVSGLRVTSALTLARARRDGIQASFILPAGAKTVRVALLRHNSRVFTATVPAGKAGSRQIVRLQAQRLGRLLRAGDYTLTVQVGTGRSALGPVAARSVRIR